MDIKEYDRIAFPVKAVEVTLDNVEEVAAWCKGTLTMVNVKMAGTQAKLPAIELQGQGEHKDKKFVATLGCFVVELNGSYRAYKARLFHQMFELRRPPVYRNQPGSNADAKEFFIKEDTKPPTPIFEA